MYPITNKSAQRYSCYYTWNAMPRPNFVKIISNEKVSMTMSIIS